MEWSSVFLLLFLLGLIGFGKFRQFMAIELALFGIGTLFVGNSIQSNHFWRTLRSNDAVPSDTETYLHWKYYGQQGGPDNELGKISVTNYEYIAEHPLAVE